MTGSPRAGSGLAMRRRWPLCFAALVVGSILLILLGVVQMLSGRSLVPGLLMGPLWLGLLVLALAACLMRRSRTEPHDRATPSQPVESEQRFRSLLESLPRVAVQGYDRQRRVIYWNKASELLYGHSADEAIGRYLEELLIPDALREPVIAAHHDWIEKGLGIPAGELELRHKSGEPVTVFSYHLMLGERTDNPLMFCVDVDLRELTQARREFELVTGFDTLSRLPDQPTFEAELSACMANCQRQGSSLAVIGIGVEPLGEVVVRDDAETCVEEDALMAMVASRLRQGRPANPVARFGSAGFVMVLPSLQSDDDVLPLLESIFEDIGQPYALDERVLGIATSIGISLFPDNGTSAGELIHTADMAMQRARLAGPDSYWFFDQSLHDELTRQYQLMQQLSHDLRDGEYVLRYQPRMTATSERIEGLEARLHFSSQAGATVPPTDFTLADEHPDLVHRLGDWVMREACRQQSQCKVTAPQDYCIAINSPDEQITQETVFEPLEAYMNDSRFATQVDHHRADRESTQRRHGREYAIRLEAALASQRDDHP
ncbi:PAS domain S-box-containing protein/diguanylate cyclase (GGDEF) domain-containing protein [Modicisalibacter muralis]|uniref:PAS domain S-box-containing protein/diguanylate cyclase (GGDEF) domain-containing protein n=1 Tax=Modicisalibacter muralis TaxID=119000 RepID=A0A1G9N2Z5_9GAMM|nr:EAL domain-containing protein [Halomonas muralis]SDL80870.1 PAS domain S-box-containing protein/diguanylate cyclase (GGDEF) domain-containing protein [Halomonas muralis]